MHRPVVCRLASRCPNLGARASSPAPTRDSAFDDRARCAPPSLGARASSPAPARDSAFDDRARCAREAAWKAALRPALRPLPFRKKEELANEIVFIPGATSSSKRWPVHFWLELHESIAGSGLDVIMLGQPELCDDVRDLERAGLKLLKTPKLRDALDAISSARAVIAVDTGLTHLAIHQCVPTTVILNGDSGIWYQARSGTTILTGGECSKACIDAGKQKDAEFQWAKKDECAPFQNIGWSGEDIRPCVEDIQHCTAAVSPKAVVGAMHASPCARERIVANLDSRAMRASPLPAADRRNIQDA
ncbi:MAG: glycosyltransferase family 9 protein [Terriglobales bacterium]